MKFIRVLLLITLLTILVDISISSRLRENKVAEKSANQVKKTEEKSAKSTGKKSEAKESTATETKCKGTKVYNSATNKCEANRTTLTLNETNDIPGIYKSFIKPAIVNTLPPFKYDDDKKKKK